MWHLSYPRAGRLCSWIEPTDLSGYRRAEPKTALCFYKPLKRWCKSLNRPRILRCLPMASDAMATSCLKYAMKYCAPANRAGPAKHCRKGLSSESKTRVANHVKRDPKNQNTRRPVRHTLKPGLKFLMSKPMQITLRPTTVQCDASVRHIAEKPIHMQNQQTGCNAFWICTGSFTILCDPILLPNKCRQ